MQKTQFLFSHFIGNRRRSVQSSKMMRLQFSLSSDQLELLLAFEEAKGLSQLAELMAKDASVVSRNLQRMAEILPVLEKTNGRWKLPVLKLIQSETPAHGR